MNLPNQLKTFYHEKIGNLLLYLCILKKEGR